MQNDKMQNVNFLFEIGCLRFLPRMWQRFLGPNVANVAEHSFRTAWIAMMLASMEQKNGGAIDFAKLLKMALAHDIAESRTGDTDYLTRQYVEQNDERATHDMLEATSLREDMLATLKEYEARESLEAKIVKDADTLDVDFEFQEQRRHGWYEELVPRRKKVVKPQLYTQSAKQLFDGIYETDPHAWHMFSQGNRFNRGEWKEE